MTASEQDGPDRREAQRRTIDQPAYYGEHRQQPRREDDLPQAVDAVVPDEVSQAEAAQRDYAFLTGLIELEHRR